MLRLAVLLLLGLSAPTPVPAPDDVDPMVARLVATARQNIGREIPGLMRLTAARGEGRTLILSFELAADAPDLLRPPQVASMTVAGICANADAAAFFANGRAIRVQVSRAGRPADPAVTVDHCPGPVGGGLTAAAFAAGLQSFVGIRDGDMTIAAFRAEGNMMIVTLAFPAGGGGDARTNSEAFALGFCMRPEVGPIFFGNGLTLRVDTVIGGAAPVPGPVVTACPTP